MMLLIDAYELKAKFIIKPPANSVEKMRRMYGRKMEAAFQRMWNRQRDMITNAMVRESVDKFTLTNELQQMLHKDITLFTESEFIPMYSDMVEEVGKKQAKRIMQAINAPMNISFSMSTDRIVKLLKEKALTKVQELSTQQIKACNLVLQESIVSGWGSVKAARFMKDCVGLNERYERAVLNFYKRKGQDPDISNRMLDYMTEQYRKRLLQSRRAMIARTEIGRANNSGSIQSTIQQIDKGIIKGAYKVRSVIMDGKEQHGDYDGERAKIDEPYPLSGEMSSGELSINCRCVDNQEIIT